MQIKSIRVDNFKSLVNFELKAELADRAKQMKPRSLKGKKQPNETRYFYNNARALALLMDSLNKLKQRLNEVLDLVGFVRSKS